MSTTMQDQYFQNYVATLRETAVGCRLQTRRMGVSRSVDDDQKRRIAELFHADEDWVGGKSKIINTKAPKYKAVTKILSQFKTHWKQHTLPYVEDGVRLLLKDHVQSMQDAVTTTRQKLEQAEMALQADYENLLEEARQKRADLFDRSQYPATMLGVFQILVDYPSLAPDRGLIAVNSQLYMQQEELVKQRFQMALQQAEQEFADQIRGYVEHIVSRLDAFDEGSAKTFSKNTLGNVVDFFERFKSMNIGSNEGLTSVIEDAVKICQDERYRPDFIQSLPGSANPIRDALREKMTGVKDKLDALMIDRPKRKIRG